MKRIAVLASGRGSNFESLCISDLGCARVELLVSDRRDAPVLGKAERLGVEAVELDPGRRTSSMPPSVEGALADLFEERSIDLVCLAGFMRLLKGPFLNRFSGRIMNVHPSLLPSFPGLRPQARALEYGVGISGCTVHYVDAGTDTGPIILQAPVPVLPTDSVESLSERILREEHRIYPLAVRLHCEERIRVDGRTVKYI